MRKFVGIILTLVFFVQFAFGADKAVVYDDTNRKIKVSDPLPFAQGGTNSTTQNFIDLSTNQNAGGIKTFTSIPVLPASDPTTDNQASRKAYTDTKLSKSTSGEINAMTEKTALADADLFVIEDSAASNAKKKVKKSNVSSVRSQFFTSSGTFTAPTGVTTVFLTMSGAGGAGGAGGGASSAGGGGAGGDYVIKIPYSVTPGNNYTVTAGASSAVFDTFTVSMGTGGSPGSLCGGNSNGGGGVGFFYPDPVTTTTQNSEGRTRARLRGGNGFKGSTVGGGGGNSLFGSGGNGGDSGSSQIGYNGTGYGAGGGGGGSDGGGGCPAYAGGTGSPGFVLVEW